MIKIATRPQSQLQHACMPKLTAVLSVPLRLHECQGHKTDSTACHKPERDPVNNPARPRRGHQPSAGVLCHAVSFVL